MSVLQVDKIQDAAGTTNKELAEYSSGNWSWGAGVPAGTVISMKAVSFNNTSVNTDSQDWQAVSQLDLTINRTSGTHLLYYLQGGGAYTGGAGQGMYTLIQRSDGTSYGSTNVTILGGADTHGHSRFYGGSGAILGPYSVMAYDSASVSGNKTYRTFYKSGGSYTVNFQDADRGEITAMIMEFIPTT